MRTIKVQFKRKRTGSTVNHEFKASTKSELQKKVLDFMDENENLIYYRIHPGSQLNHAYLPAYEAKVMENIHFNTR